MTFNITKLKEHLATPEGKKECKEFFEKWDNKDKLSQARFDKVDKYFENNDFNAFMQRILTEHDEEYINSCYKRGCEPYPNQKLTLLLDWLQDRYQSIHIDKLDSDFLTGTWLYNGYVFQLFVGQGSFWRLHKRDGDKYEQILQV